MAYPTYPGGVKPFASSSDGLDNDDDGQVDEANEADGSLNGVDYAYEITRLPIEELSPGSGGNCRNVIFQVRSRALKEGQATQEIEARLVKLCCGGY